MNTRIFLILTAFITGFFFTSCEKDDDNVPKPSIDMTELGYENSKIAYAGSDLHMEAEIVAEGNIDKVTVEIHHEGEHDEKSFSVVLDDHEWEVDTTFTEFSGLKNTTFHKHVDVPVHAETGDYHFHFVVTDMEGQQSSVEEELEIREPDDEVAPEMNISSAPSNNEEFSDGDAISITGSVSDDEALGGMYIGLVREDQNLSDEEVNATNTITMLHTHEFDSHTSHEFSATIDVGAEYDNNIEPKKIEGDIAWQSANYYIVVKVKDAFGGNWTFSDHYPVIINY